jgi:hypothetical protein
MSEERFGFSVDTDTGHVVMLLGKHGTIKTHLSKITHCDWPLMSTWGCNQGSVTYVVNIDGKTYTGTYKGEGFMHVLCMITRLDQSRHHHRALRTYFGHEDIDFTILDAQLVQHVQEQS